MSEEQARQGLPLDEDGRAAYYAAFMETQWDAIRHGGQKEAVQAIAANYANVSAAWERLLQQRRAGELLKIVNSLQLYLEMKNRGLEGTRIFEHAIAVLRGAATVEHKRLLGHLLVYEGWALLDASNCSLDPTPEREKAVGAAREGLELLRQVGSPADILAGLRNLGLVDYFVNDGQAEAVALFEEGLRMARELSEPYWMVTCLYLLGVVTGAKDLLEEALPLAQQSGNLWYLGGIMVHLSRSALGQGEYDEAKRLAQQAFDAFQTLENPWGLSAVCCVLGETALMARDYPAATRYHLQFLCSQREQGWTQGVLGAVFCIARVRLLEGRHEEALALFALVLDHSARPLWCDQEWRALPPWWGLKSEPPHVALTTALPPDTYATTWKRGKARRLDEVVEELLARA